MYLVFMIIFALIVVLVDLYFYRAIKHLVRNFTPSVRKYIKWGYWGATIFVIFFMVLASSYFLRGVAPPKFARTYITGYIFMLTISKLLGANFLLIYDLFQGSLFAVNKLFYRKKETTKSENVISRASFLKKLAFASAAIPFTALVYGSIKSAFDYQIIKKKIRIDNLPDSFKGLKIVQLSDIHSGSFISLDPLEEVVKLVNEQQPDIIFFTGDLVNEISEEALPFIDTLKKMKAPHGIFSILGNHDYGDYFYQENDQEGKQHNMKLMRAIHQKMGWKLLLNEHHNLTIDNEQLTILGVENWGSQGRFQKYGDINAAKKGAPTDSVKLLLSHDPSHWKEKVLNQHLDIAATFSGHTHGMQFGIEIPGFKWSPSQYMYEQWAGLYRKATQHIYVNRGIGFIGYPGRVGILPEISVLELS